MRATGRVRRCFSSTGWAQSSRCWDQILPALRTANRVICIDLPGFGESDKPEAFSYALEDLANLLVHFMKELELRDLVLAGHSMGGACSLLASVLAPELLRGLALMNTPVLGPHAYLRALTNMPFSGLALGYGKRYNLARRLAALMAGGRWSYEGTSVLEDVVRCSPAAIARTSRKLSLMDIRNEARKVSVPTLLVGSRGDLIVPPSATRLLADLIPTAFEPIWMDGVRHLPMVEAPDRLALILLSFLSRVTAARHPA